MMGLPYGEEIMIVGQTMWTQSTSVTDRQTDGQTDRITITKTVQRRASHGKNVSDVLVMFKNHVMIFSTFGRIRSEIKSQIRLNDIVSEGRRCDKSSTLAQSFRVRFLLSVKTTDRPPVSKFLRIRVRVRRVRTPQRIDCVVCSFQLVL